MELAPGQRFGPYEIVGVLGSGGMGVVCRARDPRLGREVALKTLRSDRSDEAELERFMREARTAGALEHPNLLVVHDVGRHEGTPYLVTELLEGQTLRELLHDGPLPVRKAVELAVQAAAGLAAAHARGVVHRDLKPENLLVTRDGRVKILDFGVARVTAGDDAPDATQSLTESGAVVGTAGYMAPEQVRGQPADPRADLFALGAILFELLTGERAFGGDTPVERGYAVLSHDPTEGNALAALPPALSRTLRHCLEKSAEARFQSARDLAFALEAALESPAPHAPREVGGRPAPRRPPTVAVVLAAGALAAAAFVAGSAWRAAGARPEAPASAVPSASAAAAPQAHPTLRRVSFRNGLVTNARFATGGRGVVYSGQFDGGLPLVLAGVLDSPQTRAVTSASTTLFDVSPEDELAIGTLQRGIATKPGAVLGRLSLAGGAVRPLVDGVLGADFAPRGELAMIRVEGGRYTLELPAGHPVLEGSDWLTDPRVSPRGDRIGFLRHPVPFDDRGHAEIVDLEGRVVARSTEAWTLQGVAWGPRGDELWFAAGNRGLQRSIRALALDGTERELFSTPGSMVLQDVDDRGRALLSVGIRRSRIFGRLRGDGRERSLSWFDGSQPADLSSDGEALLLVEGYGAAETEIQTYLRRADGSPPVLVATGWGRALSPDKEWAVVSPAPPFTTLSLVPTGPGEPRALPAGDFAAIYWVRFFPDGRRIAIGARAKDGREKIYLQSTEPAAASSPDAAGMGGAPRVLVDEKLSLYAPPAPDGKTLAAFAKGGAPVLIDVETGKVEPFAGLGSDHAPVQFTADGKGLLMVRYRDATVGASFELWRYELATGQGTKVSDIGPADTVGVEWVDRLMITPDGAHYAYALGQRLDELYLVEGLE
ncbi:MAG: protein kinase [Polyangiaceae bacterium]|nr:protein kinase [Polyangiaceae bacterium]